MMKALILREYGRLEYDDVPMPEMGPDEVLVAVKACGICGSDVHGFDGSTGRRIPPIVMGHEAAGVIHQTGNSVVDWKPGDRVTFDSTIYCGQCRFCREEAINLCDNRRVLGVSCSDYRQHGAFAEYVSVPQRILYRIPENVPFESAAMIEPVAIALHAVKRSPFGPDDTVVVVGAGMIGLLLIQALRTTGCRRLIAADIDPRRRQMALELGAHEAVDAGGSDALDRLRAAVGQPGADAAFEVVGVSAALDLAALSLRKGGALTLVGNVSPKVDFPLQAVVTREISVRGSCASAGEYRLGLELLSRGTIRTEPLVSALAPLADGASWFQRLYAMEPGLMKVILVN